MSTDQLLSPSVLAQVRAILPSTHGRLPYYPCQVRLRDGSVRDRVYLIDAEAFAATWGFSPTRVVVQASEVVAVAESHERLPRAFADILYAADESGMGYCLFTLQFRDGSEQVYLTGNAVDFLPYPSGQTATDVTGVVPHQGRKAASRLEGLPYDWCPVRGLGAATT
jgi:hypothetical protein